jgi:hypothetical protein
MGNMDDVVIDVTSNKRKVSFAIQLKHKEAENKRLSSGTLETEKGDFSLKKYCESFKGLSDDEQTTSIYSLHERQIRSKTVKRSEEFHDDPRRLL